MSIVCSIYKKKNLMDITNYNKIALFTKCYWILSISVPNILVKYTNIKKNYKYKCKYKLINIIISWQRSTNLQLDM